MNKQGIGGWLLVPALFTALIPFGLLANFVATFSAYQEIWERRAQISWAHLALAGGEQAGNFILVVCWIVALSLLFRKSSRYPTFSSVCVAGPLILSILVAVPSTFIFQKPLGIEKLTAWLIMACVVAVWSAYMKFSKRVRTTFVGRIGGA